MSSYFFALSVALLRNIREIWQVSSSERDLALSWHQAGGSTDLCHFRHKKHRIEYVLCAVSSWMNFCICAVYSHVGDFLRTTLFKFSWTFNTFEPARPTGLSCDAHGKHLLVRHPALVSQKFQIKTRRKSIK